MAATAYVRDRGVICIEASVFSNDAATVDAVQKLCASELAWLWESERSGRQAKAHVCWNLPAQRAMTRLDASASSDLVRDLAERNEKGYGRFVALFGADQESVVEILSDDRSFLAALGDYTFRETGPIRAAIVQVGDSPSDHIYLPHQPVGAVLRILESVRVPQDAEHVRRYEALHAIALERLYGLEK